ncbi:hypothetical protein BURPS1106B_A1811 [Burkholderia pseudomallei 1106b]|uniref:Uncharacterized protein n=1 Tax=Burkholderia pseudomallei (strain 1106a) TaxID=357348 RepID=A3NWX1_BURP0|nr:hypothetical protein BURPS1106A_2588 [Burkholderia pseudomallei 1106a]EES27023.1 hypothetical protein BURPS1106B_A1811 [Burkholderia pseudomallei 1106b]
MKDSKTEDEPRTANRELRIANCELRMGIRALLISIERGDSPSRRRLDSMPKRG